MRMHKGKFREDACRQANEAMDLASRHSDIVIQTGDVFDIDNPSIEDMVCAADAFRKSNLNGKRPIVIHGNHERRIKGMVTPINIFSNAGVAEYVHSEYFTIEKENERVNFLCIGHVPDDKARDAIEHLKEKDMKQGFNVLVMHQSIREFVPNAEQGMLNLPYLDSLGFDLVIDGHIHKRYVSENKKIMIPGSTVAAKLDETELSEPRSITIFDTEKKQFDRIDLTQKKGIYRIIDIENITPREAMDRIESESDEIKKDCKDEMIIKIKVRGTLKQGFERRDIIIREKPDAIMDISDVIGEEIKEKIRLIREMNREKRPMLERIEEMLDEELKGKMKNRPSGIYRLLGEKDVEEVVELLLSGKLAD
jgi:DNA repair exonuclease SbcCD nuclease subunit